MKRAIIIHCWGGYSGYCWYPDTQRALEAKGYEVHVPDFPDTDAPNLLTWLPTLKKIVGIPDRNTYLIGHSIGCITILRYLESLSIDQGVGGTVLVAGFNNDLGIKELSNFFETPILWGDIKQKSGHNVSIYSDNDPYVSLSYAKIFEEKLGARVIIKHKMKHFSGAKDGEEACTALPDVAESILMMR